MISVLLAGLKIQANPATREINRVPNDELVYYHDIAASLVCTAMVEGLLPWDYVGEILTYEKTLRWLQVKTEEWLLGC